MPKKFSVSLRGICAAALLAACLPLTAVYGQGQGESAGKSQGPSRTDMGTLMQDMDGAFTRMEEAFRPPASEMTPEDEYYLGRAVAGEIFKAYRPYTRNPALTSYLNKICLALVVNSMQPTLYSGYSVEILDTGEICAFATSGGHVFLSRGLIAAAPSEDALAGVIAHEIAHIQLRHIQAVIDHDRTINDLTAAAEHAAAAASRNLTTEERTTLFRGSLTKSINTLFKDGYSRDQEFEADRMAQLLLAASGYDPDGLKEMLRVLEKNAAAGNMSGTHPAPGLRIANLPLERGAGRDTLSSRKARFNSAVK